MPFICVGHSSITPGNGCDFPELAAFFPVDNTVGYLCIFCRAMHKGNPILKMEIGSVSIHHQRIWHFFNHDVDSC